MVPRDDPMNSRERVLAAMNRQPVDHIPTDIWATPEVWDMLRARFAGADVLDALHIDGMKSIVPEYVGPPLPRVADDEVVDYWGIVRRHMRY